MLALLHNNLMTIRYSSLLCYLRINFKFKNVKIQSPQNHKGRNKINHAKQDAELAVEYFNTKISLKLLRYRDNITAAAVPTTLTIILVLSCVLEDRNIHIYLLNRKLKYQMMALCHTYLYKKNWLPILLVSHSKN